MAGEIVVPGFRWGGLEAGIRKRPGRPDLALLIADEPAVAAAVFTQSDMAAAPVQLSRPVAATGRARAVLMNAGCANACTGEAGFEAARRMAASLQQAAGIAPTEVLTASTGVIGALLPAEKIEARIADLVAAARPEGIRDFSLAIMTTDTREKVASKQGTVGGKTVTVAGVCKGAGMIMPNMATMLACVATDASIEAAPLSALLRSAVWPSFNAVTVDGDTSTNDTLYLLASGKAANEKITSERDAAYGELLALVREVCIELAKKIAADGEGATKFVEVSVEEARDENEADVIARRIANSPLVKTAWHAADANWGRIMAAAGTCGFSLDPSKVSIEVSGVPLVRGGVGLGAAAEDAATEKMKGPAFVVTVKLSRGAAQRSVFTCDYSADYVKINAEYRT
jgi:glutamate N-acetyltransferase/amino-acid N-acetyltransferase